MMDNVKLKQHLQHDCSKCAALCCTVLPFFKKHGFAYEKPGGMPCYNLDGQHMCTIHDTLQEKGFPGCIAFSCAGAGQRVTQEIYGGDSWQTNIVLLGGMMDTFILMRQVHELAKVILVLSETDLTPKQSTDLDRLWVEFDFYRDWDLASLTEFDKSELADEIFALKGK